MRTSEQRGGGKCGGTDGLPRWGVRVRLRGAARRGAARRAYLAQGHAGFLWSARPQGSFVLRERCRRLASPFLHFLSAWCAEPWSRVRQRCRAHGRRHQIQTLGWQVARVRVRARPCGRMCLFVVGLVCLRGWMAGWESGREVDGCLLSVCECVVWELFVPSYLKCSFATTVAT